jgi:anti-anti-sigma regulatory factor
MAQFDYLCMDDFLRVTAHGELDAAETLRLHREIQDRMQDAHARNLVIDVRDTKARISMTQMYELVNEIVAARVSPPALVALVHDFDEDIELLRFFETASRNRNMQVRLFGDIDAAVRWVHHAQAATGFAQ